MERRATTPTAHAASVNRKKRNRRKESCNGTDYIDWRSAHRKIACRPLRRFAEAPGGAPELRQVRQDFHHDCGRAGADRQRRASRKGAPEHHRSGEIALISSIFMQLGDTLTTIAAHQSLCCPPKETKKQSS